MSPVLYVLRHAEAEAVLPGRRDAERPLSLHGREQAGAVGRELGRLLRGARLDRVLCSPSRRTRETLAAAAGGGAEPEFLREIYEAGSDTLVELLTLTPGGAENVLLVGHAPGVPALVRDVVDPGRSSPTGLAELERGFPPATLARLEVGVGWPELGSGVGRLTELVVTR